MSACIYGIKNKINGKYYIGQSINFISRKSRHLFLLKKGDHHSKYLQNAWNKYGEDNFIFEILEENISLENVKIKEKEWIEKNGDYNMDKNGRNPYTKQAIKNMSNAHINKKSARRLLNDEQAKYCLAINEFLGECERPLAKIFCCNRVVFRDLFRNKTYKDNVEQYNKLDLKSKIDLLKKGIKEIGYDIYSKQGGEMYGVLVHYFIFDLNFSVTKVASIFKKDTRTIKKIITGEVLPKSREIYSDYDKEILKEVSLLYYN